jgi:rubrerythrin
MKRFFKSLSDAEKLALAISLEDEEASLYREIARRMRRENPHIAAALETLRLEEIEHRDQLTRVFHKAFGEDEVIPLVRRQDVAGLVPSYDLPPEDRLDIDRINTFVRTSEAEIARFYARAVETVSNPEVRKAFERLAEIEKQHEDLDLRMDAAARLDQAALVDPQRHLFLLQVIQPGLVGLMDGSVATLAPLFAAAFATGDSKETFLVGLAASVGAAISMAFAEGLSDDGSLTGRGKPLLRGLITGLMTFVGGIGHTLPYLIPTIHLANTIAILVVSVELFTIAWIRNRYMDTPFLRSTFQVVVGGALVFAAGVLIGHG